VPSEQFVSIGSFVTAGANTLRKNIVNGVQIADTQAAAAPGGPFPLYVRLIKSGSQFSTGTSRDGTTWTSAPASVSNANLAAPGGTMQIGLAHFMFGGAAGEASFDYFDLTATPEPTSAVLYLLAGCGLLPLAARRRRRS
jgi:hypothetical protein